MKTDKNAICVTHILLFEFGPKACFFGGGGLSCLLKHLAKDFIYSCNNVFKLSPSLQLSRIKRPQQTVETGPREDAWWVMTEIQQRAR